MNPVHIAPGAERVTIGGPNCLQPYSASRLNVSAMSYGALSDNGEARILESQQLFFVNSQMYKIYLLTNGPSAPQRSSR